MSQFSSTIWQRLIGGSASQLQQLLLLRMLSRATEQRLPPAPLIEALAADEAGAQRQRLQRLAMLLRSGQSLPDALDQVPAALSEEQILAIRVGCQLGTLKQSLQASLDSLSRSDEDGLERLSEGMSYVAIVLAAIILVTIFLTVKIVPALIQISEDFYIDAPMLAWLVSLCRPFWVLVPVLLLGSILFAWWVRWGGLGRSIRRGLLSRVLLPLLDFDTPEVMRQLAVASRAGRPIPGVISTLARYHYRPSLRRKLLLVRNEIEQGATASQSLERAGVIAPAESRLLEASVILENTPWALEQVARGQRFRAGRRLELMVQSLRPLMILVLGFFVALLAVSIFSSITGLVDAI